MLCLLNVSHEVVAGKTFRMAPGERVWVAAYYVNDAALKADLSIQKHIASGKVLLRDLNPQETSKSELIHALELQADLEQKEALAARHERDQSHRRNRGLARRKSLQRRAEERVQREAQAEVKVNLDLTALFETTRKEQLNRLRRERLEAKAAPQTEPEPVESVPEEDLAPEMGQLLEETQRLADMSTEEAALVVPCLHTMLTPEQIDEALEMNKEALDEMSKSQDEAEAKIDELIDESRDSYKFVREDEPVEDYSLPSLPEVITVSAEDAEVLSHPENDSPEPKSLEDLPDDSLRKILDTCQVQGRQNIKKRESLLRAVNKLGLTIEDAEQILAETRE